MWVLWFLANSKPDISSLHKHYPKYRQQRPSGWTDILLSIRQLEGTFIPITQVLIRLGTAVWQDLSYLDRLAFRSVGDPAP